ncbi:MAG: hypothetical protein HQK77_08005 [Desulfobacterales bacterium]|nr:hypothetical protein [Desulfobacterales bacterium]
MPMITEPITESITYLDSMQFERIVKDVKQHLKTRQERQLILWDLQKRLQEIEFCKSKMYQLQKQIVQNKEALNIEKPKYDASQSKLNELLRRRIQLKGKVEQQKQWEIYVREQKNLIPDLQKQIASQKQELVQLTQSLKTFQTNHQEALNQHQVLQEYIQHNHDHIKMLETEIPALNSSLNLLKGVLPQGLQQQIASMLQGDFELHLNNYKKDINADIEKINASIVQLKRDYEEKNSACQRLVEQQKTLENRFHELKRKTGDAESDKVEAEIKSLQDQKESLATSMPIAKDVLASNNERIRAMDQEIEKANQQKSTLDKKQDQLEPMWKKIQSISNMDAEMERIAHEMDEHGVTLAVNQNIIEQARHIYKEFGEVNEQLKQAVKGYVESFRQMMALIQE